MGAKYSLDNNLTNAAFLRTQIDKIKEYFEDGEVDEIWITFPDPQLRVSKANKRLTHPKFLRLYQKILKAGGKMNLKTDSPLLYGFTKTVIEMYEIPVIIDSDHVYEDKSLSPDLKIKTHYEGLDIAGSNRIFYLCFSLPHELKDKDVALSELLKTQANE